MHSSWQRELEAQKEKPTMDTILGVMSGVYERWAKALEWESEASLSLNPDSLEQSLVNGQVSCFTAQGRSAFHEAQIRGTCVNKMYAVTHERVFNATSFSVDTPLNTVVSEVGIRFFYEDGTDMLQKLVHAGIMEELEVHDDGGSSKR